MDDDAGVSRGARAILARLNARFASIFWNGMAGALPRAALVLAGLYVARRFGPDEFARYSLAISTVMVAGSFVASAQTTVGSKFVPELAAGRADRLGAGFASLSMLTVAFAVTLSAGVFALAPRLAAGFGLYPPITEMLQISAAVVAVVVLHGGGMGLVAGSARFREAALANLAGFGVFAVSLHVLNNAMGASGTLVALGLLYATAASLAYGKTSHELRRDARETNRAQLLARGRSMLHFFFPTLLAAGMVSPVLWLSNNLLTRGADPLENLAIFNAAYTWFAVASFVPAVLAQVEFVRMSQAKGAGDVAGLASALPLFIVQNFLIMLPLTLLGGIAATFLMKLFGLDGENAKRCLQIMMAAALMAGIANPAGLFLGVIDRMWLACILNVGWGLLALGLAFALRSHGALGVAVGFLVAYLVHFVVASSVAWRYLSSYRPKLPT